MLGAIGSLAVRRRSIDEGSNLTRAGLDSVWRHQPAILTSAFTVRARLRRRWGQLAAIKQASKEARKCLYHRGTRKNDRVHRVGKWLRFAQCLVGLLREAPKSLFSVHSIVLPCSSVIKTPSYLIACSIDRGELTSSPAQPNASIPGTTERDGGNRHPAGGACFSARRRPLFPKGQQDARCQPPKSLEESPIPAPNITFDNCHHACGCLGRSGSTTSAAAAPSPAPSNVSHARAASTGSACSPVAASVTISVKA
jgi:hypothetical protein